MQCTASGFVEHKFNDGTSQVERVTPLSLLSAAFFERGQVHNAKQRWQQALQDYSRALSIQPDYIAGENNASGVLSASIVSCC
jgi:tetratricopeptide (TPR) repeat protein